jgi:K+:H+ antiporter
MHIALEQLTQNLGSPINSLILQILVIIFAARLFGMLGRLAGQPQVVGEILAGIALGPSLFKIVAPQMHAFIFPQQSVSQLFFLSQLGILLFMFIVGLELDLKLLRSKAKSAVVISMVSIAVPFLLGSGLAIFLFQSYGSQGKDNLSFALFMGIAMSITAFPVLARIIQEHGFSRSEIGTTAVACAAADDVTAWCLLAVVVAIAQSGSGPGAIWTLAFAVLYIFFMLLVVRPFLSRSLNVAAHDPVSSRLIGLILVGLLVSAWITETIGIHALFGAFLMGVAIPDQNHIKERIVARIHDVTTVILLPLFFAFTGLRIQLGLINDAASWLICALIIFVAILGKLGGAMIAARFTGHSWRNSLIVGTLMNTRGLIELIVLNVGYDLGILSPKIFTIMVIMALVTTMMTGPLLRLLKPRLGMVTNANSGPAVTKEDSKRSDQGYQLEVALSSPVAKAPHFPG